ncbi:MAG: PH domain-containing protein [Myxococcota bacterium]
MSDRGAELERFSRFPTWRLAGLGLLLLVLGDELLAFLRTGELRLPPWLGERGVVLLGAAVVFGVLGLGVELTRQLVAELRGEQTLAAVCAKGLVVRRRFRERFVPWGAIRELRTRSEEALQVTITGTVASGARFHMFDVRLDDGSTLVVREAEGGFATATLIAERAQVAMPT